MAKKVKIQHVPHATFMYAVNIENAGTTFDDSSEAIAWVEIPVSNGCGTRRVEATVEWLGRCYTQLVVNAGVLGNVSTATLFITVDHDEITYACDPIVIEMVG